MSIKRKKSCAGFTLVEIMVAMAIGLIVTAALFVGLDASMNQASMVGRRTEMQQNVRLALNAMVRELQIAGTNFPTTGVTLPPQSGANPSLGVAANPAGTVNVTYITNGTFGNLPVNKTTGANNGQNVLYAVNPVHGWGPADMTGTASDAVTIAYADPNFVSAGSVSISIAATKLTATSADFSTTITAAPWLDNSLYGVQVGDIILFVGPGGSAAMEVTSLTTAGAATVANFNLPSTGVDPLGFNAKSTYTEGGVSVQDTALGYQKSLSPSATFAAYKLNMVTYFLYSTSGALPLTLMRQLNGRVPTPIADNVSTLQFTYDVFNGTGGTTTSNEPWADTTAGTNTTSSPQQIRKVNAWLGIRSVRPYNSKGSFDNFTLGTSVSPRNLDYVNRY